MRAEASRFSCRSKRRGDPSRLDVLAGGCRYPSCAVRLESMRSGNTYQ
jgi:hypothetical protein